MDSLKFHHSIIEGCQRADFYPELSPAVCHFLRDWWRKYMPAGTSPVSHWYQGELESFTLRKKLSPLKLTSKVSWGSGMDRNEDFKITERNTQNQFWHYVLSTDSNVNSVPLVTVADLGKRSGNNAGSTTLDNGASHAAHAGQSAMGPKLKFVDTQQFMVTPKLLRSQCMIYYCSSQ